jgi:hypothetical protein
MQHFKFSNCQKTTVAQKLSENFKEKCQEFLSYIYYKQINHKYFSSLMRNIYEILLIFDLSSNTTIDKTENKTISIRTCGHKKLEFTIVLVCMANRKKLSSIIIFKLKKISYFTFPFGIIIQTNS